MASKLSQDEALRRLREKRDKGQLNPAELEALAAFEAGKLTSPSQLQRFETGPTLSRPAPSVPGLPAGVIPPDEGSGIIPNLAFGFGTRGPIQAVTAPLDIATIPGRLMGLGTESPTFASMLEELTTSALGIEEPKAVTLPERAASRIGEEIGAGLTAFPAIRGIARFGRQPQIGPPRTTGAGIRESLAEQPNRAVVGETIAATGAGTGATALSEAFPGSPAAEATGQIIGGTTPAGVGAAARKARQFSPFPTFGERAQQEQVGRTLAEVGGTSEGSVARLERSQEVAREIPGFKPTTAQAIGDPGLLAAERAIINKEPLTALRFREREADQNEAIREYLKSHLPEGPELNVSQATVQQIEASADQAMTAAITRAQGQVQRELQRLGPAVTPREAGLMQREVLLREQRRWKQSVNEAFAAVDPERKIKLDTSPVRQQALAFQIDDEATKGPLLFDAQGREIDFGPQGIEAKDVSVVEPPRNVPRIVQRLLKRLPEQASFEDLRTLRSVLINEINMEAMKPNPNRRLVRRLEKLRDATEKTLDTLAADPVLAQQFPDEARLYGKARAVFRQGAKVFRQGPVAEVLKPAPFGEGFEVAAGDVPLSFWQRGTGNREAVDDLIQAMGSRKAAQESVRGVAVHDLRSSGVLDADGKVRGPRLEAWLAQHAEVLDAFPQLKAQFATVSRAQQQAEKIAKVVNVRREQLDDQAVRLFTKTEPDKLVDRIRASQNPKLLTEAVVRTAKGDPGVKRSLRRALWQRLVDQAEVGRLDLMDTPMLSGVKWRRYLNSPATKPLVEALYSKDEIRVLENVQKALDLVSRSSGRALPSGSDTAQNAFAVFTLNQLLSRAYNVQRGVVSKHFVQLELATRFVNKAVGQIRKEQLRAIMDEALFDPEYARTLMMIARGEDLGVIVPRLKSHIVNLNLGQRPVEERDSR